ncbi:hypothetical protein [Geobacillus subterraneus]|uniref:hypothetical protein n=1 Tax=Geobacillus subterraneus TaxID=129338 RepID=UPI0016209A00
MGGAPSGFERFSVKMRALASGRFHPRAEGRSLPMELFRENPESVNGDFHPRVEGKTLSMDLFRGMMKFQQFVHTSDARTMMETFLLVTAAGRKKLVNMRNVKV